MRRNHPRESDDGDKNERDQHNPDLIHRHPNRLPLSTSLCEVLQRSIYVDELLRELNDVHADVLAIDKTW